MKTKHRPERVGQAAAAAPAIRQFDAFDAEHELYEAEKLLNMLSTLALAGGSIDVDQDTVSIVADEARERVERVRTFLADMDA